MPDHFPTAPRAPEVVRIAALTIAVLAALLAARTTVTSSAWVGRVFPGFVVLDNGLVAAVGLGHWAGSKVPDLYWREVVSVDGAPVRRAAEIYDRVASLPLGTTVTYGVRAGATTRTVTVSTDRFTRTDWFLLFGPYLVSGSAFLAAGLVAWVMRPLSALTRALAVAGVAWAVMMFTAMDLYGPASLQRLYFIADALMPAALLQLVALFPESHRYSRWRGLAYVPAILILLAYQFFLYSSPVLVRHILYLNYTWFALLSILFGVRLIREYWRARSELARQRILMVSLGTVAGFAIPGAIVMLSASLGGQVGMNLATFTNPLFALALAYAIVKHDLFEIDAMVKRGAYYLVLTGAVGAAYIAAVVLFNLVLRAGAVTDSAVFPIVFTFAVLMLLDPLRTRLQAFVDRVFFRTGYDAAKVLAAVGEELAASVDSQQIGALVRRAVDEAIPSSGTRLAVLGPSGSLVDVTSREEVSEPLRTQLARGLVVTTFDPMERYASAPLHDAVRASLVALGAEIAVPLRLRPELVGALLVGPKRSGLFYTAGDAEFLRALAHQAAIALENSRTFSAVSSLNAQLEERVRERTAQLETTNHDLAHAYAELKATETKLVQTEKMASLGRLVAGVAHEINNPVSFIVANVTPLRRRLAQAASSAPPRGQTLLREAAELADIMARGADRTASIVRDLRSFSRVDDAACTATDLHDGLETSLRLLAPRWSERVTVHRDYDVLPTVECDAGQLNQVFMNVLANAFDAIRNRGNVWITTRADADTVTVSIRDDGPGIPPDALGRIFDPFFTTKDVGSGTGLGLAISHGIVAAHGGRLEVDSRPGAGAVFRVTVPIVAAPRAAGG